MLKLKNFNGIQNMNHNKVIITVVIVLLLMCPTPSYDIRMYTTSILGRITLIIATIAVICYDAVIGIFAILLLLKLTGKPLREGAENMDDGEKKEPNEEEPKRSKTKKDRFLDKHCACSAMYDEEGKQNGASWESVCKVDDGKEDNPETNYLSAQFWTQVPKYATFPLGRTENEEYAKEQLEASKKEAIYPLIMYLGSKLMLIKPGWKEFKDMVMASKGGEKTKENWKGIKVFEGDDPTMNQFHYTDGRVCNPCDKQNCTNWELGPPPSNTFGSSGGGGEKSEGGGGGSFAEKLIDNW